MLVGLGAVLVDTDAIAHGLTAPGGAALPALQQLFGDDIVAQDGAMDRARMRALAFADAGARQRLEAVLHPMIGVEAERQAALALARPVIAQQLPRAQRRALADAVIFNDDLSPAALHEHVRALWLHWGQLPRGA